MTIGFGDLSPTSEAGRPIFIVYALLAVPTMTIVGIGPSISLLISVQTVTSNFTSYMSQRFHRQKHQVYKEKDFEIYSLNSLVKTAKQKECERLGAQIGDKPVELPFHEVTERLIIGLHQLHNHLQNWMMKTLGGEARNVIVAERSRQLNALNQNISTKIEKEVGGSQQEKNYVASHLSELGLVHGEDELELLNEYREQYAAIIAEVLVVRERILELEKELRDRIMDEDMRGRIHEEIEELNDDDINSKKWSRRKSLQW